MSKRQMADSASESGSDNEMRNYMMGEGMDGLGCMDPQYSKKFLAKLDKKVLDRVTVLQTMDKKVEEEQKAHDAKVRALRLKYNKLAAPIMAKRKLIISGDRDDITDAEVRKGFPEDHKGKVSTNDGDSTEAKGLPGFWYRVLSHHVIIDSMISERDAECLMECLEDISFEYLPKYPEELGFTLTFTFDGKAKEGRAFSNTKLSKTFYLKQDPVEGELMLERAVGTKIDWLPGMCPLNKKLIQKKQKSKKGASRTVTREEPCESFFDFFKTDAEGCQMEENEQAHAMAEIIKDKMIPYAVEYYTGEADNGEDDMEDEDYGDEDEEEEDEDGPQMMSQAQMQRMMAQQGGKGGAGGKQECPQQ